MTAALCVTTPRFARPYEKILQGSRYGIVQNRLQYSISTRPSNGISVHPLARSWPLGAIVGCQSPDHVGRNDVEPPFLPPAALVTRSLNFSRHPHTSLRRGSRHHGTCSQLFPRCPTILGLVHSIYSESSSSLIVIAKEGSFLHRVIVSGSAALCDRLTSRRNHLARFWWNIPYANELNKVKALYRARWRVRHDWTPRSLSNTFP